MHCPATGTTGVCVLKVVVPNTVIAEVTTCSCGLSPRYQPFFPASAVGSGSSSSGISNRESRQITLEPQAATLKLRLAARGAPVLADVFWDIRDETGVTVWTAGLAEPAAVLRAGRYTVRAETRDKRYDRTIELRAGESRLLELAAD